MQKKRRFDSRRHLVAVVHTNARKSHISGIWGPRLKRTPRTQFLSQRSVLLGQYQASGNSIFVYYDEFSWSEKNIGFGPRDAQNLNHPDLPSLQNLHPRGFAWLKSGPNLIFRANKKEVFFDFGHIFHFSCQIFRFQVLTVRDKNHGWLTTFWCFWGQVGLVQY